MTIYIMFYTIQGYESARNYYLWINIYQYDLSTTLLSENLSETDLIQQNNNFVL